MLIRYQKGPDGKPVKKAVVYTEKEHGISLNSINLDAVRIIDRLRRNGHEAYIVGGAVRDLILGKKPKDYDIVTDAEPSRIRKLFYRSRVIGRRFRLVHVYAGTEIFEVSTFRSIANGTVGNTYGKIDEDARRRDFSLNALYFDPLQNQVIDYVGGFKDIKAKKIIPVIPLKTIFVEDPVRMIRAVKYSSTTGFSIPFATKLAIKKYAPLLSESSISRLCEEASKILFSGYSLSIMESLSHYNLLTAIFPGIDASLHDHRFLRMKTALCKLDNYISNGGEKRLCFALSYILEPVVEEAQSVEAPDTQTAWHNVLDVARKFLEPLTLPRIEVEEAVRSLFHVPEQKASHKRRRRRQNRRNSTTKTNASPAILNPTSSNDIKNV